MKFVSYAQNLEDVMLWRALKNVKNGFYIDIGAWSPDADSVTKAFYERGWHGINVDPNPNLIAEYADKRPKDLFLNVGVSDTAGRLTFNLNKNSGLSTFVGLEYQNPEEVEQINVELVTLEYILEKYAPSNQIHFLKIDVEGFEEKVIQGNGWNIFRPWILVIESTAPNSTLENANSWRHIIENAQYSLVYRDGLNHFYIANEHQELLEAFLYPPNIFDDYITSEFLIARKNAQERLHQVHELESLLKASESDRAARFDQIRVLTDQLKNSESDRAARLEQINTLEQMLRDANNSSSKIGS
jgi:FkbM family methyltransferase